MILRFLARILPLWVLTVSKMFSYSFLSMRSLIGQLHAMKGLPPVRRVYHSILTRLGIEAYCGFPFLAAWATKP